MARGMFRKFWVEPRHAETLRAMKPKAEVIVPAYKQTVEI
jgi:hypothetical protein